MMMTSAVTSSSCSRSWPRALLRASLGPHRTLRRARRFPRASSRPPRRRPAASRRRPPERADDDEHRARSRRRTSASKPYTIHRVARCAGTTVRSRTAPTTFSMASTASVVRSGMSTFPRRWQEQGSYPASPFEELVREQAAVDLREHEDQRARRFTRDNDERRCTRGTSRCRGTGPCRRREWCRRRRRGRPTDCARPSGRLVGRFGAAVVVAVPSALGPAAQCRARLRRGASAPRDSRCRGAFTGPSSDGAGGVGLRGRCLRVARPVVETCKAPSRQCDDREHRRGDRADAYPAAPCRSHRTATTRAATKWRRRRGAVRSRRRREMSSRAGGGTASRSASRREAASARSRGCVELGRGRRFVAVEARAQTLVEGIDGFAVAPGPCSGGALRRSSGRGSSGVLMAFWGLGVRAGGRGSRVGRRARHRPRAMRDRTVPIGMSSTVAISA